MILSVLLGLAVWLQFSRSPGQNCSKPRVTGPDPIQASKVWEVLLDTPLIYSLAVGLPPYFFVSLFWVMKQICLSLSQCFIEHLLYVLGYHSQGPSGRAIPVRLLVHSEGDEWRQNPAWTPLARPVLWLRALSPRGGIFTHRCCLVAKSCTCLKWVPFKNSSKVRVTHASENKIHEVLALISRSV